VLRVGFFKIKSHTYPSIVPKEIIRGILGGRQGNELQCSISENGIRIVMPYLFQKNGIRQPYLFQKKPSS
jgi:hypothetical protein